MDGVSMRGGEQGACLLLHGGIVLILGVVAKYMPVETTACRKRVQSVLTSELPFCQRSQLGTRLAEQRLREGFLHTVRFRHFPRCCEAVRM